MVDNIQDGWDGTSDYLHVGIQYIFLTMKNENGESYSNC